MYENIKYEELKQLPDEQKKEVLQELMDKYGSNKAIAEATGGALIAISNMYSKYVEGKPIGRKKKEEVIEEAPKNKVSQESKPKRKYTKRNTENTESQEQEIVRTPIKLPKPSSFTTSLSGDFTGEELKERIIGLANSLLSTKTYSITLQLEECQ